MLEDVEEPAPHGLDLGVPADDVCFGRIAPVPGRAHDDVCDHRVAFLDGARPGDAHRAAHLCGVRPREEIADELDRSARSDLRRRLSDAEELDLADARHRGFRDRLLPEPAQLVPGLDPLQLVPVLEQPDPPHDRGRVHQLGRELRSKPGRGAGDLRCDAQTAGCRDGRNGSDGSDEPGDGVEVEPEAPLAVPDLVVRLPELCGDGHLVAHHDERALSVGRYDEPGRPSEVAPVTAHVVDVVGAEEDGAVDPAVGHPGPQALEAVGRPRQGARHVVAT